MRPLALEKAMEITNNQYSLETARKCALRATSQITNNQYYLETARNLHQAALMRYGPRTSADDLGTLEGCLLTPSRAARTRIRTRSGNARGLSSDAQQGHPHPHPNALWERYARGTLEGCLLTPSEAAGMWSFAGWSRDRAPSEENSPQSDQSGEGFF